MDSGGWSTGTSRPQRRVRVTKTKVTKRDRTDEILPLDPRDPDIVRAKGLK
jgi:hypothetical protein